MMSAAAAKIDLPVRIVPAWNSEDPDSVLRYLTVYPKDKKPYYILVSRIEYYSERYNKWIYCEPGMPSDGATGATDLPTVGWWVHDQLCNTGKFADGTKCSNWQASSVLRDALCHEGRWFRARSWRYATFIGGGGKARSNGLFRVHST